MIEVNFKVETEAFEEWLFNLHHRFQKMVQTMIDVHYLIQAKMNSMSLIPLDTGRLEESYHYDLVRSDETFIELHSVFDAVDPKYGFHYAEYQHELMYRGRGTYSRYTRARDGISLTGKSMSDHHRHGIRGTDHYLLKGVQASEDLMWTIIETDYMTLFNGGI